MADRADPSRDTSPRQFTAGIVGFAYLAFAGAAMAAWIAFLVWIVRRLLAET